MKSAPPKPLTVSAPPSPKMLLSALVPVMVSARSVPKHEALPWQVMVAANATPQASTTVKAINTHSRTVLLISGSFPWRGRGSRLGAPAIGTHGERRAPADRLGGGPVPYHAHRIAADTDVDPGEVVSVVLLQE